MDFQSLLRPIHLQQAAMTESLLQLASINSGTLNPDGVNRVGDEFAALFCTSLRCWHQSQTLEPYPLYNLDGSVSQQPLGDLHLFSKHPAAPLQVLLTGHLDTVFPPSCAFQHCSWLDQETLNGPGVSDMKGGLLVMLEALKTLESSPLAGRIGWTVLLNPDEEIGSPGSAILLQQQARKHDLGLIYEPALPDGQLAGERKGSGNFTVIIKGRAAHAGREHHLGRNAICAMAELVTLLDQLNGQREGVTLNVGVVSGGETTNQVPDRARCRFNIRTLIPEDEPWCLQQLQQVLITTGKRDGIELELHGGFGRQPKQLDSNHLKLYQLVTDCAGQLGSALSWQATGGCCDGNNLSAAGLPNVDTLGVLGGKIHSDQEFIRIDSLVSRARLSALLLLTLASEPELWQKPGRSDI